VNKEAYKELKKAVAELQELNKEILVGKRKLDCLSCGDPDYHTSRRADS